MPAFLEIMIDGAEQRIPLGNLETLGRDKSNSIHVQDNLASRSHALIRRIGTEQFYLLDGGSRNGSYINEQRVATPTLLRNDDHIAIGDTIMTFIQEFVENKNVDDDETDLGETISFVRNDIRTVTILVADIRGYTTISEHIEIKVLSKLMSKWFYEVQSIVEKNNGRVDKFIGDCVMALWDQQSAPEDMVRCCLKAAFEIHELTTQLGEAQQSIPEGLQIGAGVNTGIAALGVGHENTAMGDTVNTAFRLEAASKELGKDMIISQSTYNLLPKDFWSGQEQEIFVKGRKKPVRLIGKDFDELKTFLDSSPDGD
jgi:adenylate cyclase